jgi:hypothetical protein
MPAAGGVEQLDPAAGPLLCSKRASRAQHANFAARRLRRAAKVPALLPDG